MWFLFCVLAFGTAVNGAINMPCPKICPEAVVQYTCTITGDNTASWTVRDTSGAQLGVALALVESIHGIGVASEVGTSPFSAKIDSYTENVELVATISYNGTMDVTGYQVQCGDSQGSTPATCTVEEQEIPSAPTNLTLSSFTTASVLLTFDPPDIDDCVINYNISLNGNTPTTISDTSVMIMKPAGDPPFTNYTVSIVAVDTGGRIGHSNSSDCFLFSGPQAVLLNSEPQYMSDDNCSNETTNAVFSWKPMNCLPSIDNYTINHNGSGMSSVVLSQSNTIFIVTNITLGEMYYVEITPNNVIGPGESTTTVFSVPSDCPTVTSPTASMSPSMPPFMSPSMSPPSGESSSVVAIGVAVGATIIVIAIIVIVILAIVIVVVKKKSGNNKTSPPKKGLSYHRSDYENANEMVQTNGTSSDNSQGALYADISHDKKKSAKPAPKNNEQVTYSDINHPPPTEYADLEHGRGTGKQIPKKSQGVVYSAVSQQ